MLQGSHSVHIEYEVEVSRILSPQQVKTMTDKTAAKPKTVVDKEGIRFVDHLCEMFMCVVFLVSNYNSLFRHYTVFACLVTVVYAMSQNKYHAFYICDNIVSCYPIWQKHT